MEDVTQNERTKDTAKGNKQADVRLEGIVDKPVRGMRDANGTKFNNAQVNWHFLSLTNMWTITMLVTV